jgi:hypothetical protein
VRHLNAKYMKSIVAKTINVWTSIGPYGETISTLPGTAGADRHARVHHDVGDPHALRRRGPDADPGGDDWIPAAGHHRMDPAHGHGDGELHRRMGSRGGRHHAQHGAVESSATLCIHGGINKRTHEIGGEKNSRDQALLG